MRKPHPPGMDHTLYTYSPLSERPTLVWPNGARVALWTVLYLEYYELDPPEGSYRDPRYRGEFGNFAPEYRTYSTREYGNRVGFFRVLEVLDKYKLPVTVAVNAAVCERYPYLIDQCRARDWEFAAHGTHATRMLNSRMDEAEERAYIAQSIEAVEKATGQRPRGWISQDMGETPRTPDLLAEAGLDWLGDWPNDDQPYMLTLDRPMVSLPYHVDWDDAQLIWLRRIATWRYPEIVGTAFDRLYAEGVEDGRMMSLGIHPWIFGQAHRIRYLDEALAHITGHDGVWAATAGAIADAYRDRQGG